MQPEHRRPLSVLLLLLLLALGGAWGRQHLGVALRPEALRGFVQGLGPLAPLALYLIISFRGVLGIPSQLLLIVTGICFGTLLGALYGTLGLTTSGLVTFLLARYGARDVVARRLPERWRSLVAGAGKRGGAVFIAVGTGYPVGFITAYHALAGLTPMRLATFLLALAVGSSVRALTYTFFGSSLLAGGIARLLEAALPIAVCAVAPLLFPSIRGQLRAALAPVTSQAKRDG